MATRTLRLEGDEILRKVSKPVKEINEKIIALLDDMAETLKKAEGVGLAAPQIGVLKRIVIIDVGDGLLELINPKIIENDGIQNKTEGCLSIPGKIGDVDRPEKLKVKFTDRNGSENIVEATEILAVAVCHELDHLDGIMYTDKATDIRDANSDDDDDEEL